MLARVSRAPARTGGTPPHVLHTFALSNALHFMLVARSALKCAGLARKGLSSTLRSAAREGHRADIVSVSQAYTLVLVKGRHLAEEPTQGMHAPTCIPWRTVRSSAMLRRCSRGMP